MRGNLSVKGWGVSLSAVMAVPYVLVMLASLLVVGVLTTGGWQAAFLGIGWNAIVGFELGLLGIVAAGFAVAGVFFAAGNAVRRGTARLPGRPSVRPWAFRLLAACLVLPALALVTLRLSAPLWSIGQAPAAGADARDAGGLDGPVNLGAAINTAHREAEPSFTADGRTMYFNCFSGDICVARLEGTWAAGSWTPPERLGAPINTEYEEVEPIISPAGDKLYFTSTRPGGRLAGVPFLSPFVNVFTVVNTLATARFGGSLLGGLGLEDVYVSHRIDGAWSEPRSINDVPGEPPVNTEFADHCLFFSADGDEVFWTSTRPGGLGDNDIWTARRVDGAWTEPENLGPNVNGPGGEHTSIPTPDGRSLYVTTARADGYGGEDNYVTARGADGRWGPLVNLGPRVNGPGDDRCPAWTPDLKVFLFDSVRPGGLGGRDIWWVPFEEVPGGPLASGGTIP